MDVHRLRVHEQAVQVVAQRLVIKTVINEFHEQIYFAALAREGRKRRLYSHNMILFTIGYEGLSNSDFFSILQSQQIETLVDVRELPLSRKPGFSKKALTASCLQHGLNYTHLPALGCPRTIRHTYRENNDWAWYTRHYLTHLQQQPDTLSDLAQRVQKERCCLLCFEADPQECHRLYVAAHLAQSLSHLHTEHLTREHLEADCLEAEYFGDEPFTLGRERVAAMA